MTRSAQSFKAGSAFATATPRQRARKIGRSFSASPAPTNAGGFAGPSEAGFGMRLDDREPWVVDLLEVDDASRPGEGTTGARVVAEHVL